MATEAQPIDFKLLLDAIKHPVFVHDQNFKIIYANKAYAKAAKTPISKLRNQAYWQFLPKHQGPTTGCFEALEKNQTIAEELQQPDGKTYVSRSFPVLKNKNYAYSVHILEDISKQAITESLSNNISLLLNDTEQLNKNLKKITRLLGKYTHADRCYIFLKDDKDNTFSNTHEWCSPKTESYQASLQQITVEQAFPWVSKQLYALQTIQFDDTNKIPRAAHKFKAEMQREGIISVLFTPIISNHTLLGFIGFDSVKKQKSWQPTEIELLKSVGRQIALALAHQTSTNKQLAYQDYLETMLDKVISTIMHITEIRDPYTAGHQRRVAELAVAIAEELNLPEERMIGLELAALIHDIGKIHIPAEILNRPGKLSDAEFEIIRTHSEVGYEILTDLQDTPWPIADIVLQHHERLDGSGYPNHLKAKQILLEAKIIAVADVYESMTSHRPYRAALDPKIAKDEFKKNRGTLYDAKVVDACFKVIKK